MRCDQISEKHKIQYLENIRINVISDDKNEVESRRNGKKTFFSHRFLVEL